jgi:hypothetical protein
MHHLNDPADTRPARRARVSARALIGLSLLLSSCATPPPEPPEPVAVASPAPGDPHPVPAPPPAPARAAPPRKKAPPPPKRIVMTQEMDEKIAPLLLSLLEREAQIQNLEKKLDDAIQETVRSKAKLASLESRAEAASNLAEAEVGLKTLAGSVKGLNKRPEVVQLTALMKVSAAELKKENYGGSLFLTNQIKGKLMDLQDLIESEQQQRSAASGKSSASAEFDTKIARLQALLVEKDAQVQKLHRKLDDTIQEAVRTKSKLRSQENKAEAASTLAEAETAMKMLNDSISGADRQLEAVQGVALMRMGADEFKKENYSGSLYATNQVKAILKDIQENSRGRHTMTPVDGEVLFALPLSLRIAVSGKVHEGPAAESTVAWSVERGASPTAVSYKGPWIRVKDGGNRWGWIFYDLIASP